MKVGTGYTVIELVESVDVDNNPVSAATFNSAFFIDGVLTTGVTLNVLLSDPSRAIFKTSFSGSTFGTHQFHLRNLSTNVIFVSDTYDVRPDNEINPSPTIYVGL
jgi:tellurite resistance protein TehA-like permease